ncbi:MAG TPA: DUF6345 domain-containing protein [Verrucomicrobiae bacterium]|jgi:hypothetical protein|nr:DUF6345 domain-containing protein [Verrucomicrobiae bacterium]
MKLITSLALIAPMIIALSARSQTNLQFTAIRANDEGAIHLEWVSQSNHTYQIQCADTLIDTNTSLTPWQMLYDNYPSQGTNTFWLDTGNYLRVPAIIHPSQSPMRFYRLVDKGSDDLVGDEPIVSISSPTNGSTIAGLLTVSVDASSDQGVVYPKLYVDGQEMWPSSDGTNYSLNTCEWPNGPHILFATVSATTAPDGPQSSYGLIGYGVSSFVTVNFSNLVTRISFSQPFFDPAQGKTQQVSAVFAANSDWTLHIADAYSNVVRTVTGSGDSMQSAWDGTDDNSNAIPNGVYYYYISAQTNGLPPNLNTNIPSVNTNGPPSPMLSMDVTELYAIPSNGFGGPVPLVLYPPGFDTNELNVFEASTSEVQAALALDLTAEKTMDSGVTPDASGAPSAQDSPAAPTRPQVAPVKGTVGKIGVGWQMYNANGTNPVYAAVLPDGSPIPGQYIQMEGHSGTTPQAFQSFRHADLTAINFLTEMRRGAWNLDVLKDNDNLKLSDLQGSGNPFNNDDIALLILHGVYGTTFDDTTGHPFKGIYFPIASGGSAQYLRMSDMSLGGPSPTNGLKWMAIMGCTSLYQQNWNSMKSQGVRPYNGNMHMILGATTDMADEPLIGQYWADDMLGSPTQAPVKIRDAWFDAANRAYKWGVDHGMSQYYINPTTLAVAADANCSEDLLQTNSAPTGSGGWTYYISQTAYPPQ